MVTIEVTNANGQTCEVAISWEGYTSSLGMTDKTGRVSFNVRPGTGKVYIDGDECYKGRIEGVLKVRR